MVQAERGAGRREITGRHVRGLCPVRPVGRAQPPAGVEFFQCGERGDQFHLRFGAGAELLQRCEAQIAFAAQDPVDARVQQVGALGAQFVGALVAEQVGQGVVRAVGVRAAQEGGCDEPCDVFRVAVGGGRRRGPQRVPPRRRVLRRSGASGAP
ncbi:hypothetical protein ACWV95_13725 [Streptomyces albus]